MELNDQPNIFGGVEYIYSYSRQDAVDDGVLIDVTEFASQVMEGVFKIPLAITATIWNQLMPDANYDDMNMSEVLTLRDFLLVIAIRVRNHVKEKPSVREIKTSVEMPSGEISVLINSGPGDDAMPVLTIMSKHDI